MKQAISTFLCSICILAATAQNPFIKCYFNYPVNTVISTGANAQYLNGTFPDTIAAYINRAKYTIDVAMYNFTAFSNSRVAVIATAINNAAARGVVVRWIYNGTGDTQNSGLSLLSSSVNKLASPNYSGYIMHNKFMVIDVNAADSTNAIVQTGSYNFSDAQTTGDYNNIVFVQSKQVALAYYNEFNKMWGGTGALPNTTNSAFSIYKTPSANKFFLVNKDTVEVYFSPKDSVGKRLINNINTADHELLFGIYTFTDYYIANAIRMKYQQGIYTRGIMDKNSTPYTAYSVLSPVMGNDLIIYNNRSKLYHNKIMLIDALNPESDPQVFTGSFNWTNQAQYSNDENAIVIHNAGVANQYYQSLCKNYSDLGGLPCVSDPCSNDSTILVSYKKGSTYKWQVDSGNGFVNLSNSTIYKGVDSASLQISNAASSWYGYHYRCLVDGSTYSTVITLQFAVYWNGSYSNKWEDAENWNCGKLPDANTDVYIKNGVSFFPEINTSSICRSIHLTNGSTAKVNSSGELLITGQ